MRPALTRRDELNAAVADLEVSRTLPYYDAEADARTRVAYYAAIEITSTEGARLHEQLATLLRRTHTNPRPYKPARWLYPWIDLRENGQLRSIYSGIEFDPRRLIEADFAIEAQREERLEAARSAGTSGIGLEALRAELEKALPYNCERVVPQSWFRHAEPMKGDLHHLFTCETDCNSFRGSMPYFDFPDFQRVIRENCGKHDGRQFEPGAGKGPVARATLYYLLRYPGSLQDAPMAGGHDTIALLREQLETLLTWHETSPPDDYERHRNAAIMSTQGNRNPLVDHLDLARRIEFAAAF